MDSWERACGGPARPAAHAVMTGAHVLRWGERVHGSERIRVPVNEGEWGREGACASPCLALATFPLSLLTSHAKHGGYYCMHVRQVTHLLVRICLVVISALVPTSPPA